MVFAARLGNIPATQPFTPGPEWREFVLPLASFSSIDGSDLRGVLFSAGSKPGPFRFTIDDVRFRYRLSHETIQEHVAGNSFCARSSLAR